MSKSTAAQAAKDAVHAMLAEEKLTPEEQAKRWQAIDLQVEHEGEKMILPAIPGKMPKEEAIRSLKRMIEQENKEYEINEPIHCHFFDGLVALARALHEKYGFVTTGDGTVNTFFGKMKVPPKLIHVRTGPGRDDMVQVPYGTFSFPGIEAALETKFGNYKGIPVVRLVGSVKAKDRRVVMDVIQLAQEIARRNSIYRGQSVILRRAETGSGIDLNNPLDFFDPGKGDEIPIFNKDTERLIETTVMAPLRHADVCRKKKIPLKRGVLLEGPYGTGKTLLAKNVAKVANENGFSFILVTAATALTYALNFAKMYQPAIVFAEDIDRIAGDRNEGANDLINEIDGVVTKNDEIITVLTTNFAHQIDKAFLRPGRLDTVVSIRPPEPEAVERLILFYAREELEKDANLESVKKVLAGQIPATIREVVERSKLAAITDGRSLISADDLEVSALGMKNHWELIERASEGVRKTPTIEAAIRSVLFRVLHKDFGFDPERSEDASNDTFDDD